MNFTEKEKIVNVIKQELGDNNIKIEKIILFGSRAKGEAKSDSDWDIYVVVDKELDFREKSLIIAKIQCRLAEMKIPNDIIIRSKQKFEENKNVVGYISYYANKEGIVL
jgi:predicted nucleotidyltransferase